MSQKSHHTADLLQRAKTLEQIFATEQILRADVVQLITEGLSAMMVDVREIETRLPKEVFSVRRRTGVSLVEAATAIQKGMSLLGRLDSQTHKPFSSLKQAEITPGELVAIAKAVETAPIDANDLEEQNNVAIAQAEDWVHSSWGRLWIQILVAWSNGYGQSGYKTWLEFLDEVYNIGDETPRSRSWLRRKFDEVYERCTQQPDLKKIVAGVDGWLPPKPGRGRKSLNPYRQSEPKIVKSWVCTGEMPTGKCEFRITPKQAVKEGLNFPAEATQDDRRRCVESLFCGGLCVADFK